MGLSIRPLRESDLNDAQDIYRDSFTAFLKMPDSVLGQGDFIRARFLGAPNCALGAEIDGALVGINFQALHGTLAVPGPVAVRSRGWTGNAGRLLNEAGIRLSEMMGAKFFHGYTFAQSPGHVEFHQRVGFYPRFLTATMSLPLNSAKQASDFTTYSTMSESDRAEALRRARELTDQAFTGMDWSNHVRLLLNYGIGDTVFLWDQSELAGFSACHFGKGSEAEKNAAYLKLGIVRPGAGAPERFTRLMQACSAFAWSKDLRRLDAGVNTGREAAYRHMQELGYRISQLGVSLARPNIEAYMRPSDWILDDGR